MREKLIELLKIALDYSYVMRELQKTTTDADKDPFIAMADFLIANGVTFATDNNVGDKVTPADKDINVPSKWIPLSERKPGRDDLVIVFFEGMRDTPAAIQIMYGWCIGGSATHWMPLPEPPKENDLSYDK